MSNAPNPSPSGRSATVHAAPTPAPASAEAERIKALAVSDVAGALRAADALLALDTPVRERVRLLAARAHALSYANEFERAARDLAEAAALAREHDLTDEIGPILLVRIQPLARAGRLDEAEDAALQACAAFSESAAPLQRGKAEVNLGIVRRMRGHAAEAVACFDRAVPLLGTDPASLAAVHSNRAVALLELDRFDQAAAAFAEGLDLLQALGRAHAAAIVTGNIADLLARTGRIEQAMARFDQARHAFAAAGATADSARLDAEEAEGLFAVGAYIKCLRLLQGALPQLAAAGLRREHARAQLVFGLANLRVGHLAAARPALLTAAQDADFAGAGLIAAEARIGLSELAGADGRLDEAADHARAAAALLADRPVRSATALLTLASVHLRAGRAREALDTLALAEQRLGADAPAPLRARAAHLRSAALRAGGDPHAALRELRAAIATVESFRGAIRAEQIRTAYLESSQQLFIDLCGLVPEVLPESDDAAAEVFDAAERLRARTLLDAVRDRGPAPPSAADRHDAADLAELNALYSSLGPASSDSPRDAERRRARLHTLEAARETRADRRHGADTAAAGYADVEPLRLAEAVRRVPPSLAIVSFHADGDSFSAHVLRPGSARLVRRIVARDRIASLSRRFHLALAQALAGLTGRRVSLLAEVTIELHARLFDPLHDQLADARHVQIVPFGELHGLPLHAAGIVSPDAPAGRVESYVPGVSIGLALADVARPAPSRYRPRVAVIGGGDHLAPEIERELHEIAESHPDPLALIGPRATAAAALDAVAAADLVHLASHAVFDPDFPMSSRLQLADRWITARELAAAIRPGATLLLAGCDTGRAQSAAGGAGRAGGGEDRSGLVRGVLASRAAAVLSTAWPLHDATARTAMVRVHRHLSGAPEGFAAALPAAVSRIQRELAAEGAPFEHWASLFVSGAIL